MSPHYRQFFSSGSLRDRLEGLNIKLMEELARFSQDEILTMDIDECVDNLVERYAVLPPKILRDKIYFDEPASVNIDLSARTFSALQWTGRPSYVNGTSWVFHIPIEGEIELLWDRASTFTYGPPGGSISGNEVILSYELTEQEQDADKLEKMVKSELDDLEKHLQWTATDVSSYNQNLGNIARSALKTMKDKAMKDRGIAATLPFSMKRRSDAPRIYTVPLERKKVAAPVTTASGKGIQIEPALENLEYENILKIITNMVNVMERSPRAFVHMNEEDLRTHFLVQLNGQYEGQATGETFNYEGKTDIMIKDKDRALFIAECKFWDGEKAFTETIDQILRYLSWRDTKAAIIIFNRRQGFSEVLRKLKEAFQKHPNYVRGYSQKSETEFRGVFHHKDDNGREITLSVLAFNLPEK